MRGSTRSFNPWWVVVASFCGLFLGTGTIGYVFGIFLRPVSVELNIGRSIISTGLLISAAITAVGCPFIGIALDKYGSRKVMVPLAAIFAATIAAFALMVPSTALLMGLFVLFGLSGVAMTPIPYARLITLWFDRQRGLALGAAIAGSGLGIAVVPKLSEYLIATQGWRAAFVALGVIVLVAACIPIALWMREPVQTETLAAQAELRKTLPGMEAADAFRTWRLWATTIAFFFSIVACNGAVSHLVALLTDRGMAPNQAATAISLVGLAALFSRLVSGWLLDRMSGVKLAIFFFVMPAVGIAMIASGMMGAVPFIGAVLCGIAIGGEVDLLAFFVSRYFGVRNFGKIYGLMFAFFAFGFGVGPFISGVIFDIFHSYQIAFGLYIVILVVACLLVAGLGPYKYPAGSMEGTH